MRILMISLIVLLLTPAIVLAKVPHTVDFNRGENDTFTGRAPSYEGEAAQMDNKSSSPQELCLASSEGKPGGCQGDYDPHSQTDRK